MTYHSDPTRWTQSQGLEGAADDGASELLRSAFRSGKREGPDNLQMHALALKLAAVGSAAALSTGAATAHASSTGAGAGAHAAGAHAANTAFGGAALGGVGAAKTGGALTLTKLALSMVLVGATATGTVVLQRSGALTPMSTPSHQAAQHAPSAASADVSTLAKAPTTEPSANRPAEPAPLNTPAQVAPAPARTEALARMKPAQAEAAQPEATQPEATQLQPMMPSEAQRVFSAHLPSLSSSERRASRAARHRSAHVAAAARSATHATQAHAGEAHAAEVEQPATPQRTASGTTPSVQNVAGQRSQLSEIELLGKARSALAAHPRDAYRLAQQHKELYPQGVFAQERDALAVEAAQRAGELKLAQQLAESFVQRYPSSPHAHRFRETMNLQ